MKLLFTSYACTPEYNDPERWLHRIRGYIGILEELAKEHEVIAIERIDFEGELFKNGVRYIFQRQLKTVLIPVRQHRLIRSLKPDVVLVNGLIFPLQVMQLRKAIGNKAKIILMHRSERPATGLKGWLQKVADRWVDAYLFSTLEFRKEWESQINFNKVHQTPLVSSVFSKENKELARKVTNVEGAPVFIWVGRLEKNKDPQTVVNAFSLFAAMAPSARLFMIYQQEDLLPEIRELVAANNIQDAVILVGKIEHSGLQEWFNAADFMISSSHYEGGGAVVAEAMSCGCIPIVSKIPSFLQMTGNGKYGLSFEPGNEKDLLECLEKTVGVEAKVKAEAERVLEHFKEELSFEAIGRKINRVLRDL